MKLAIFGATGQTGLPLLRQALDSECTVKAMVRNVEKLQTQLKETKDENGKELSENENLVIVKVKEDLNSDEFVEHLQDVDAVISTLGFPIQRPSSRYLDFTKSIVAAMKKTSSCRRLILMHSWYSKPDTRQNCPFLLRYTLIPYIACLLDDMSQAEEYLQNGKENSEAQDIDYTVILPGGLINKPVTDLEFVAKEGEWFVSGGGRIHREDVARYLLKTAKEHLHSTKIVAIKTQP